MRLPEMGGVERGGKKERGSPGGKGRDFAFSGSCSSISMSNESRSANFLKSTALPSITGLAARAPMFPKPRTAVPLVMTPTETVQQWS